MGGREGGRRLALIHVCMQKPGDIKAVASRGGASEEPQGVDRWWTGRESSLITSITLVGYFNHLRILPV